MEAVKRLANLVLVARRNLVRANWKLVAADRVAKLVLAKSSKAMTDYELAGPTHKSSL